MELAEFNFAYSLIGGVLLGLSSALLLLLNGRIAGMSGIFGGMLLIRGGRAWRLVFVVGLVIGGLMIRAALPERLGAPVTDAMPILLLAGFLVGFGTRIGSGCTSGHGICGLARFSPRSLAATLSFIGAGAVTVVVVRALGGMS